MTPELKAELEEALAQRLRQLLPPGRRPKEAGAAWSTVRALASTMASADEQALDMLLEWSPSHASVQDSLAKLGAGRSLKRFPGESLDTFRARLVNAYDFWRRAGTEQGILQALSQLGYKPLIIKHYRTDSTIWAEFSIALYPDQRSYDGSEGEQELILSLVHETKSAHEKLRNLFYVTGGTAVGAAVVGTFVVGGDIAQIYP